MGERRWLTDEERARVVAPPSSAWTLAPACYIDPEVFERELDTIFGRDWLAVARSEQIASPGDQLAVDVGRQPVVLVRDESGAIRAFANVCAHRAMPLVDDAARGRYLTCPYHLWSYDLTGALRTAPLMDGADDFDVADICLPEYPVEEWHGFVFVSLDTAAPALGPQLEALGELMAPFGFADKVVVASVHFDSPWNWKLLVENFMEAYHHTGPHRSTLQPQYPAARSFALDNQGQPWTALRMPGDHGELVAANVWPTLLIAGSDFGAVWYQLRVDAHDHFALTVHLLDDPALVGTPEFEETLPARVEALSYVHVEDIAVNEGPWRGLHAPSARQGRLSPLELAVWQLNQLWIDRVDPR